MCCNLHSYHTVLPPQCSRQLGFVWRSPRRDNKLVLNNSSQKQHTDTQTKLTLMKFMTLIHRGQGQP